MYELCDKFNIMIYNLNSASKIRQYSVTSYNYWICCVFSRVFPSLLRDGKFLQKVFNSNEYNIQVDIRTNLLAEFRYKFMESILNN